MYVRAGSHVHKGIEKLKALKYFAGIDFDAMIKGKAKSPYKVKSKNAGDVSNFDKYDEPMIKWYGDGPVPRAPCPVVCQGVCRGVVQGGWGKGEGETESERARERESERARAREKREERREKRDSACA